MTENIRNLKFEDIKVIKSMYGNSSDKLKNLFAPTILVSKLMYFLFQLSIFLRLNKVKAIVFEKDNEIVGFAYITKFNIENKQVGVMIKEGFQNQGRGTILLEQLLIDEEDLHLSVDNTNSVALKLYLGQGFKETTSYTRFFKK